MTGGAIGFDKLDKKVTEQLQRATWLPIFF
jgi:hypothetical protein